MCTQLLVSRPDEENISSYLQLIDKCLIHEVSSDRFHETAFSHCLEVVLRVSVLWSFASPTPCVWGGGGGSLIIARAELGCGGFKPKRSLHITLGSKVSPGLSSDLGANAWEKRPAPEACPRDRAWGGRPQSCHLAPGVWKHFPFELRKIGGGRGEKESVQKK